MINNYLLRNRDTAHRIIDGVAIIVNPETGKMYTLNEVGTYIWEHADGRHTISDIIDGVCEMYEVDKSKAVDDVNLFINDLTEKNVVVLVEKELSRNSER